MLAFDKTLFASLAAPDSDGGKLARLSNIGGLLATTYIIYLLGLAIYRLWFHPLARFPGPPLFAVTELPFLFESSYRGTFTARMPNLHRRYGKIVRIAPNLLAVDGSVGWADICAHRPGGNAVEFHKFTGYSPVPDGQSLITAPNRDSHRRQRRILSHAFSDAAMYEQEPFISQYVDLFIRRLSETAANGPINMLNWLNFLSFDVIGDLALGESFGSLKNRDYHFWVKNVFNSFKGINRRRFYQRSGLGLLTALDLDGVISNGVQTMEFSRWKAEARMALGVEPLVPSPNGEVDADGKPVMRPRRDFISYMIRKTGSGEGESLSHDEILNNASTFIIAGSETTATNLSTFLFQIALPRNRALRNAVTAEIRSRFQREADVDLRSTQVNMLPLLHACLEESLRYHPPGAEINPRVSPGAVVGGHFVPEGTIVTIYMNATFRNPDQFADAHLFRPERFLPQSHPMHNPALAAGTNLEAFKPFSHGPRNCIGKNLAYAEMRLVAARVLLRFDVELADGMGEDWLENQRAFNIWEKSPLMLRLIERTDLEPKGR